MPGTEIDLLSDYFEPAMVRHQPPLMTPGAPLVHSPSPTPPEPPKNLVEEILEHQDDPLYFTEDTSGSTQSGNESSLLDLDPLEDEHLKRKSRHPNRKSNWTESAFDDHDSHPARSPSLPPSPTRLSVPEVQRTQSYFTPSSLVSSSFPTRWMSSLLSRTAQQQSHAPQPAATSDNEAPSVVAHIRAATVPGPSITHGSAFAAKTYIAPSGAPGFSGDHTWDKGFQFDKERVERASLRLMGRKEVTIGVLTVPLADKLRPHLPALKRLPRSWSLLYSLDQHGISLNTLYTRCESHLGGALIVMCDANDTIFGVWVGEGVRLSKGSYYGSGESFLWKMQKDDSLHVYKWTGKNDYVALCEPEYISFGGGDGHYGLYLDDTLSDGSSARCPTYDNDPLCSPGPRQGEAITFECVGLEVWGVG